MIEVELKEIYVTPKDQQAFKKNILLLVVFETRMIAYDKHDEVPIYISLYLPLNNE